MGKTLKDIIRTAGLCSISATVGASLVYLTKKETPVNPSSNYKIQRTEMQSLNLLLNRDDKVYFVTNKNEEEGIKDIKKIINNSNYEEAWLYLPEKQIWYETGFYSDSISVCTNYSIVNKILEKNKDIKELVFYHNHPWSPKYSLNQIKYPSTTDVVETLGRTLDYSNYNIKGKVCSKGGVCEYSLTEKARKEFEIKNEIKIKDYYHIKKDAITFNKEYLKINFKPFEDKKCH